MVLDLLKKIRMAIGENLFSMEVWCDSVIFNMYEVEVPVVFKAGIVFIDCENYYGKMTAEMLEELSTIMGYIEDAKSELYELLNVGDKCEK